MIDNNPVSVIIPVYNGQAFIEGALKTLADQDYRPLEIIVVDDGSTDDTAAIVKNHPEVSYFYQDHRGPSAARNQGIKMSTSEYITFLDVDDRYPANKIKWQANYLNEHPGIEVVVGGYRTVYLEGMQQNDSPFEDPNSLRAFVNLGASMYRRSVFDQIGLFAEDLFYSEDVDWFLRCLEEEVAIALVKKPALLYRLHQDSYSHLAGEKRMRASFFNALRRSVRRRQQEDGSIKPLPNWTDYFEDAVPGKPQKPVWKSK